MSQEEPSDRKPDPWFPWMVGHAQVKCVMTVCLKTQIRLTRHISLFNLLHICKTEGQVQLAAGKLELKLSQTVNLTISIKSYEENINWL